ncbi:MAG: DUF1566 domain-containing protein [Thermoanaerobaculia bacterium]
MRTHHVPGRVLTLINLVLLCSNPATWAGDGLVALQTADSSCPDDSGAIYVDCGNGTVTDNRTGLVWLKNANCIGSAGGGAGSPLGKVDWFTAMEFVAGLSDDPSRDAAADDCGLSDGSSPGEWRLPSRPEWEVMIADGVALGCTSSGFGGPSITDDSGLQCWQEGPGNSFSGVVSFFYWSAGTRIQFPTNAWVLSLNGGFVASGDKGSSDAYVWSVRGGQ